MFGISIKKKRLISALKKFETNGGQLLADEEFFLGDQEFGKRDGAVSRLFRAAQQGHIYAIRLLSILVLCGKIDTLSDDQLQVLHRSAYDIWEDNTLMDAAVSANLRGDEDYASQALEMAAVSGNPEACERLARHYEEIDTALSKYWLLMAFLNHSDNQRKAYVKQFLSALLDEDEMISDPHDRDYQNWFVQFMMGIVDESTKPFTINQSRIVAKAARTGYVPAVYSATIVCNMSDSERKDCLVISARAKIPKAMYEYGLMLLKDGDIEQAKEVLGESADSGCDDAALVLGKLADMNSQESLRYLLLSASNGNIEARKILCDHPLMEQIHRDYFKFLLG